jgi:hypothetical protein
MQIRTTQQRKRAAKGEKKKGSKRSKSKRYYKYLVMDTHNRHGKEKYSLSARRAGQSERRRENTPLPPS